MKMRDDFLAECQRSVIAKDSVVDAIYNKVLGNLLQVTSHSLYTVKASGGANTFRLVDPSDNKTIGLNNFSMAKPSAQQLLMIDSIRLTGVELAGVPTNETMKGANFGSIKGLTALQNGEIDIWSGGKIIVKDLPLSNFITDNRQNVELGTFKLGAPKFAYPDEEIKAEIRTGVATNNFLVVKLELIGICTSTN